MRGSLIQMIIVKDATGKYFTNEEWCMFWSKDPDHAYHFNNMEEVQQKFDSEQTEFYFIKGILPVKHKTIFTHKKNT